MVGIRHQRPRAGQNKVGRDRQIDWWLLVLAVIVNPELRDEVWDAVGDDGKPVLSDKLKFWMTVHPCGNAGHAKELVRDVVRDVVSALYVEQGAEEVKAMTDRDVELRVAAIENRSSGAYRRIGGCGVPYGKRSRLLPGGFYEQVENRALAKTLTDQANVVSRLEHHPEWLLGTTDSGSMRLRDDPNVGIDYEVDLPPTTAGNDTYELTKRGDIRNASMGFVAYEEEFRHEKAQYWCAIC